jgi:hypothetical protein
MRSIATRLSAFALVFGAMTALGCAGSSSHGSKTDEPTAPTAPAPQGGSAVAAPSATDPMQATANVHGRLTDLGDGDIAMHLGGAALVANAKSVQIAKLSAGGELDVVAKADVEVGGGFSLKVPVGDPLLIVQALNDAGIVIGSAILGVAKAGVDLVVAPITTETSLKAELLIRIATSAQLNGLVDLVPSAVATIEALVDAKLAGAIAASLSFGADFEAVLGATADAILTAQATLLASLKAAATVDIDAKLIASAQLAFIAALNVSLDTGAAIDVAGELIASIAASTGLAVHAVADALISASVGFEAAIKARLSAAISVTASASASAAAAVFAGLHAAANLEAQIVAHVTEGILVEAGVAEANISAAVAAGVTLVAKVAAAVDVSAILSAKAEFHASLMAGLKVVVSVAAAPPPPNLFQQLTGAVAQVGNQLRADVQGAVTAAASIGGGVVAAAGNIGAGLAANIDGTAKAVLGAQAQAAASVQALVPKFQGDPLQVSAVLKVDVLASASVSL